MQVDPGRSSRRLAQEAHHHSFPASSGRVGFIALDADFDLLLAVRTLRAAEDGLDVRSQLRNAEAELLGQVLLREHKGLIPERRD